MYVKLLAILVIASTLILAGTGVASAADSAKKKSEPPIIVLDKFDDISGTLLGVHAPDTDGVGGGWDTRFGSRFAITADGKSVADRSGLDTPYFAVIDGEIENVDITVDFTRSGHSSVVGLLFRWIDSANHYRAEFDKDRGRIIKVVGGVETELDSGKAKWKPGKPKSLRVIDNDGDIGVLLDKKKIAKASDPEFFGETHIGIFYRNESETAVRNFEVRSSADPVVPIAPEMGDLILQDTFDTGAGLIDGRPADNVLGEPEWADVIGTWAVGASGLMKLDSPSGGGDQMLAIPVGQNDVDISADITWNGGVVGIGWGIDGPNDRIIAFWDGYFMVVGRITPSPHRFVELGRAGRPWTKHTTKNIRVRVNGSNARIYVDDPLIEGDADYPLILVFNAGMGTLQRAGVFGKGTSNTYDNFVVRESVPLAQPDPILNVAPPQILNRPPLPSGARVFDSFTYYTGDVIQNRGADLDPSGQGWRIVSGRWQFFGLEVGELREASGDKQALIDTGRDEYSITSEHLWDGGRTGISFGVQSPDNRNGFLFFKQSDGSVFLGKKIGGVFFTLDSKKNSWKIGKKEDMRVEVSDGRLQAYVGKKRVFDVHDEDLRGATWVGVFHNGFHLDRFDNFLMRLPRGVPEPTPIPPPIPVVVDDFSSDGMTSMIGRVPEIAPFGSSWQKATTRGIWQVQTDFAVEIGTEDSGIRDRRITIDSGISDGSASVDMTVNGTPWTTWFGRRLNPRSGLVIRTNETNSLPVMWFYDGVRDLIASSGATVLARVRVAWAVGDTHTLSVVIDGNLFAFKFDESTVSTAQYTSGVGKTYFGLFAAEQEAGNANTFDNFEIAPLN